MFDFLLLSAIFVSLLAGQFARIELVSALVNIYIHEILLLIFIGVSFFRFGLTPVRNALKSKAVSIFLVLLFISFLLSFTEFTLFQNAIALLYLARLVLYFLFGVYLVVLVKRKKSVDLFLYRLIYTFSILLLVITAIQYVFYPNFWVLFPLGWDPHLYRASAAYFDIFIAAAIYGMLAFFWLSRNKKIVACLFVIALVLSFSRSAYVAFALSLFSLFIFQKKWKELLISLTFFIVLVIIIPKPIGEGGNLFRTSSINSRIHDYQLGLTMWQKKPLFGVGYNKIRFAKEHQNLISIDDKSHSASSFHSSFLVILVTTGIAGFSAFMFLVGTFFKKYPSMRVYVLYILTMSLFDNVFLHVLVILPLIFIAANNHSSFE